MKAILRNCLHGSHIVVAETLGPNGRRLSIVKSSTSADGIRDLRREWDGYQWYLQWVGPRLRVSAKAACATYFALEIGYVEGRTPDFAKGLLPNREFIARALRHYADIWTKAGQAGRERACAHGDFSIDNFIFSGDSVVALDWEHFAKDAFPIGFDGLHLLYECLWFELDGGADPSPPMIKFIREQLELLKRAGCLHPSYEPAPLARLIQIVQSNISNWGGQLGRHKDKLPVLRWSPEDIRKIDSRMASISAN